MSKQTMIALKPFKFRGAMLKVEEELEPDNESQGKLLNTIGLAKFKRRAYRNRAAQVEQASVMTSVSSPDV